MRRPHPGAVRLALVALLLLGVGFLLREQIGPGRPRTARHRHQHERAQSLDQALADMRAPSQRSGTYSGAGPPSKGCQPSSRTASHLISRQPLAN
ncbi:MAG: hypothetical protein WAV78_00385, partial [Xanthobacteraceae bacterium]